LYLHMYGMYSNSCGTAIEEIHMKYVSNLYSNHSQMIEYLPS